MTVKTLVEQPAQIKQLKCGSSLFKDNSMSTIVICPNCKQINIGSKLNCVYCQTSLIGVARIQGESPLPDYTPPAAPEKHQEENGTGVTTEKIKKR